MKLIKISPKFQITIPKTLKNLCRTGWFALVSENDVITLRPVDVQPAKSEEEIFEEDDFRGLIAEMKKSGWRIAKIGNEWTHYCSLCGGE